MSDDTTQDATDDHALWLRNPHTVLMAKHLSEQVEALREYLIRVASSSSDPAVSAAYGQYFAANKLLQEMRPKDE